MMFSRARYLALNSGIRSFASSSKGSKSKEPGETKAKSPSRTKAQDGQPPKQVEAVTNKAAGDEYLVPEYYEHNVDTYGELFVEMDKYRIPQPSAKS
jgi:hypothetical protein